MNIPEPGSKEPAKADTDQPTSLEADEGSGWRTEDLRRMDDLFADADPDDLETR